ncbi:Hpc2p [Cyberlindnera jadinii NRRL Y-1542]|uniref:Histone promoter control 2 n=1 Tax=Cyberlindnera jadinii (strain ATCC 18201 / CBS 1600 / BCRC 20928 / JCM 3617 / NBRC 0987 / NRRL Y-1542) TaxID=983966 RepID=A0A1E4S7K7_CYBJN|nr:histone promoter control 2 [Cyberlindnera jadinii NRRL Y-1542]ODV75501.1 histone promoter control 2 [Cyberlindnera jadinii NRRL Y-1542]
MADKGDEVEAPKEKPKAAPRKKSTKSSQQTIKLIRTVNDVPANPKKKTMQPSIINLMNLDDDVPTAKTAVKSMSSTADTTNAVDTTTAVESEAANTSAAETLPQSNAEVPATATTATPSSTKDKPKVQRKRKPADPNTKKKVTKKTTTSTSVTPSVDKPEPEKPVLSFNELQNQSLKKPNPSSSLPPPQMVDTTTKPTSKEEPIVAIHVPLFSKDESLGSTQVVFNVMKMCEDKYGWKAIHPNASKFDMDLYNDDELDEDDDNDAMDDDQEQHEEVPKVPVKIDKRRLQKGKPKIGQYDYEDPFIDDSETLWEEQRASTKDGFFVYWGPLVEEGKNAVIERADGTVKRTRKRVAGTTNNAGTSRKRQATNKQAVQIAPAPSQSTSTTKASASKASSATPAPVEHTTQDGEPATTSS